MFRLVDVCKDMQILNILARNHELGGSTHGFYQVKNALMGYLYQHGRCTEAKTSVQEYECWNCDGSGIDGWNDGESCRKCGGTGVYRRNILYAMTFLVDGKRFRWHIPESLVDWEVKLTEERQERFQEPGGEPPKMTKEQIRKMLLRAWIECQLHGVQGLPPLKPKGWLERRIWRPVYSVLGEAGHFFRKIRLEQLANKCILVQARIWRYAYGN